MADALTFEGDTIDAQMRRRMAILAAAVLVSVALLFWISASWMLAAAMGIALFSMAALGWWHASLSVDEEEGISSQPDWAVLRAVADEAGDAVAIGDRAGRLVSANDQFVKWFSTLTAPPAIGLDGKEQARLAEAGRIAWRDGRGEVLNIEHGQMRYDLNIVRAGQSDNYLAWIFRPVRTSSLVDEAIDLAEGALGRALGRAGAMAVSVSPDGRIRAANSAFAERVTGSATSNLVGRDFASFMRVDEDGGIFVEADGRHALPMRLVHVPLASANASPNVDAPSLLLLLDGAPASKRQAGMIERAARLLDHLPTGLALVDRDGRFLFANPAFRRLVDLDDAPLPPYPGDLVVREDKGALADTIRRYTNGRAEDGETAVRLKNHPDEVVSIAIAGIRGMGEAAVLLSLKDDSEETRLKRQVAQATKMQAVGQLAGGVAHDFNNILTAIIGYCDLMLMRHPPGDSDYDDIQQIKNNSNRAASLTRQLLAFSRQQTLRPQTLQLPDVVSNVSILLKRLMGEKVELEVHHDRGIGAVRADPGQLEQVIVNLAVNARDAMLTTVKGRGTLTIRTAPVTPAKVRAMKADILPPADYARITISDTGAGIPKDLIGKIFEPFFTTKPVGKGTGLGLSTVYGIVKQSGGYIFASSPDEGGARFDIYLPVYRGAEKDVVAASAQSETSAEESWGSGSILLVEDEDMVRAVAERALTRQGYSVDLACDGEEAVELLRTGRDYDLIISDVVMPNMDGPAMARKAREMRPEIPLLFMSGYAEEQLRNEIDVENMHFIPKPFNIKQISQKVGQVLRASRD